MRRLVRSQIAARLKKVDREVRHVSGKPEDADAIHDLRVSIRRLKQVLKVFEKWFEAKQVDGVRKHLRKLMDRCAAVRNCDVAIEVLRTAGWKNPKLFADLDQQRKLARGELADMLKRWRRQDRVVRWSDDLRVVQADSQETVGECAQRLLPEMVEDLFRAGREAVLPESSHKTMHRLRLKAKRVRYTLELFESVYGERSAPIMDALKGLQEKLGAINDCAVTLDLVRRNRGAVAALRRLAGEREAEFRAYATKNLGPRNKMRWEAVLSAADREE